MGKEFEPVNTALKQVLDRIGVTADTLALFTIWEKEAGYLAKACKDICLKGHILYVEVNSPAHVQEIMLRKHEFIRKINGHFSYTIIRDIRYMLSRKTER